MQEMPMTTAEGAIERQEQKEKRKKGKDKKGKAKAEVAAAEQPDTALYVTLLPAPPILKLTSRLFSLPFQPKAINKDEARKAVPLLLKNIICMSRH